jgi:hypothetical protein
MSGSGSRAIKWVKPWILVVFGFRRESEPEAGEGFRMKFIEPVTFGSVPRYFEIAGG